MNRPSVATAAPRHPRGWRALRARLTCRLMNASRPAQLPNQASRGILNREDVKVSVKRALQTRYKRYAYRYPQLFNAQQRYTVLVRDWIGYVHEEDFRALALFKLRPNALCVDIGANKGQSITSIKRVLPSARIMSFEPNPATFSMLKLVASRHTGVTTYNMAVGAGSGDLTLCVPRWRGITFDQLASRKEPDRRELAEEIRSYGFASICVDDIEFDLLKINVISLDRLGLHPDFIKVDVEGGELDVLLSAKNILGKAKPLLLIERGHRSDIEDFLATFHYGRCAYIGGTLRFDHPGSLNSFYVHEHHVPERAGWPIR